MIIVEQTRDDFSNDYGPLLKSFFPDLQVYLKKAPPPGPGKFYLKVTIQPFLMRLQFFDENKNQIFDVSDTADLNDKPEYRNVLKCLLYRALCAYTQKTLPWGAQTGVRPAKAALERLEAGWDEQEVRDFMKQHYLCSDEKTELSLCVAKKEQQLLADLQDKKGYSVYIGIAFCPSKCLYCSFASYGIGQYGYLVEDYLKALFYEIDEMQGCMGDKQLQTIYVGGGTPTALDQEHLKRLLDKICNSFDFTHVREFTVEAGRPDSLDIEKLRILKQYGVTRISINPQTMNTHTLEVIGRKHTPEDVKRTFYMARDAGHDNINMDLIMGLPGETIPDVEHTLSEIETLSPDSLTVHTLAIKRAADLNIYRDRYQAAVPKNTAQMLDIAAEFTKQQGYQPYYLYRQKNMTGNLENVGYAHSGKEGLYNILMMEDRQTILALGAGATCKYIFQKGGRIERTDNCKSITDYIDRIDEMIDRKKSFLYREGMNL